MRGREGLGFRLQEFRNSEPSTLGLNPAHWERRSEKNRVWGSGFRNPASLTLGLNPVQWERRRERNRG
jgi:hypothetical protein